MNRIRLESISFSPDGSFTFWFNDSDLFGGHAVVVSGTLKGGITDSGIEG